MPFAGDIVVKAEILFSAATSTVRSPIVSRVSERSGENGTSSHPSDDADESEAQQLDSSTDEAAVPPSRPSQRPSFEVEAKSDEILALKTASVVVFDARIILSEAYCYESQLQTVKTYTFITGDAGMTSQMKAWRSPFLRMRFRERANQS
ncbi:hypothetical protein FRC05_008543 [Tulasnella sp. 425]|nr:hypothetical protein FRC05_008543 [Tulasnella sp. 425]